MKLRMLVTNRAFLFGMILYVAGLAVLSRNREFFVSEGLIELLIFGLGFPLLAWIATIRAKQLGTGKQPGRNEMLGLFGYLIALSIYLAFGPQWINSLLPTAWIANEHSRFFITLAKKLIVFVAVPFLLFGPVCGHRLRDFGCSKDALRELTRSHLPVVLTMSAVILVFQYFLGGGAAPLREGRLTGHQILVGIPFCFVWLAIEAGLVEEFFFRGLLQARLSGWFRSEITGVVLMALAFGLAHAPGFIFRHAGVVEGLGANPSALDAIAYSIVTLAVSGIFLGIIWARTRNLFALIIIHAAIDLLPNLSEFVRTWGL